MVSATVGAWTLAFPVTASGTVPVSDGFYGSQGGSAFVAARAETIRIEPETVEVRFVEPALCAWADGTESCQPLGPEASLMIEGPAHSEAVDITTSSALTDIASGEAPCVAPL